MFSATVRDTIHLLTASNGSSKLPVVLMACMIVAIAVVIYAFTSGNDEDPNDASDD